MLCKLRMAAEAVEMLRYTRHDVLLSGTNPTASPLP